MGIAVLVLLLLGCGSGLTIGEKCNCPTLNVNFNCTCKATQGYITSDDVPESEEEVIYWITPGRTALVLFYFTDSDLQLSNDSSTSSSFSSTTSSSITNVYFDLLASNTTTEPPPDTTSIAPPTLYPPPPCSVTIGDHYYATWGIGEEVKAINIVDTDTSTPVIIVLNDPNCYYNLSYATYEMDTQIIQLNSTTGNISAPADPSGFLNYRPNSRYLYLLDATLLDPSLPSNVKVDFFLHHLDLGGPSTLLHKPFHPMNYTSGDFFLVGTGQDVLSGNEAMFYGHIEDEVAAARGVRVVGALAHVLVYTTGNVYPNATGFFITYNTTERLTTEAPPTTTPAGPVLPNTFVAINGIPVEEWYNTTLLVKEALADMCTDYLHNYINQYNGTNIIASEVRILDTTTCDPFRCWDGECVAYNFGVTVWEEDGTPILSEEELKDMLATESLHHYVTEIGQDCEICQEEGKMRVGLYVGVAVGVVVLGVVLSLIAWKYSDHNTASDALQRYERDKQEKLADQRRRSSGDISMLGLGISGSVASRGTLASRRFTMPFPKPGREDESDEDVDLSGYREYDPDLGYVQPVHLGIKKEPVLLVGSREQSNLAYVDDEEKPIHPRRISIISSGTDSDEETITLPQINPKARPVKKTQFMVPADVHSSDLLDETEL